MKKIVYFLSAVFITGATISSCHKIDVPVVSELTPETFPQTEAQYNAVMGPVYTLYRDGFTTGHFFL